jgi:hypothetical protein
VESGVNHPIGGTRPGFGGHRYNASSKRAVFNFFDLRSTKIKPNHHFRTNDFF